MYKQEHLDEVDRLNFTQIIDFFTNKLNTLNLVFVNKPDYAGAARVHCEDIKSCVKSVHFPIIITVCLPSTRHDYQSSPFSYINYSCTRWGYDKLKALIIEQRFMPLCYSNSDQTVEEFAWISEKLDSTTPRRTQHRRCLTPWITPDSSNWMNRLSNIKKVYEKQPQSISKRNCYD